MRHAVTRHRVKCIIKDQHLDPKMFEVTYGGDSAVRCYSLDEINWPKVTRVVIVNSVALLIYKGYYEDPECPNNDGPILHLQDRFVVK